MLFNKTLSSLFLLVFMLSSAKADATLTFALSGAGVANSTRTLVLSDSDGLRVLNWAQAAYGPVTVPPVRSDEPFCSSNPKPADCLPTTRELTRKEAIEAVFDGLLRGLRHNVINFEKSSARKTAEDSIGPINPR